MTDKELIERYPWLRKPSLYKKGEFVDGTMLDYMPEGWRIAFGEQMCEEINNEILTWDKIAREKFHVTYIKNRWGGMRFYVSNGSKKLYEIIDKYEEMSKLTCIKCGGYATYMSTRWIAPYCKDCAAKLQGKQWGYERFIPLQEYYKTRTLK